MGTLKTSSTFQRSVFLGAFASIVFLGSTSTWASVIAVNQFGQISAQLIPAPPSTTLDSLFGGANVFEEVNGLVLGADLAVDIASAGIPGIYSSGGALSPSVIPAGTRISSALVHFDLPPNPVFALTAELGVRFDENIIGVIISDERLDASDPFVGNPGTIYPTGLDQRGTTTDIGGGDKLTVGFPLDILSFDVLLELSVDVVLDHVRIITLSPIPEPTSLALAAFAAMPLLLFRRLVRPYEVAGATPQ